ncbi:hypothetical protein Tco_1097057, partial [Tanacetum coccineum]
ASLHVEDDPVDVEELEFLLLKGLGLPGKRGIVSYRNSSYGSSTSSVVRTRLPGTTALAPRHL